MSIREFKESPWEIGVDEQIAITVDVSNWPGSSDNVSANSSDQPITSPVAQIKTLGGTALTDTDVFTGSAAASSSDNEVTTPRILGSGLTAGNTYRLEVRWVRQSDTFEAYGMLLART